MIPVLYDKNEKQFRTYGLGELSDYASLPEVKRIRNGGQDGYFFYMTYENDGVLANELKEGMQIKASAGVRTKWQTFDIKRVKRETGKHIEVWASHISLRTMKDVIKPNIAVRQATALEALRLWNSRRVGDEEWDVWSDIDTVSSTTWDIDQFQTARDVLGGVRGSILDVWGGEYEFDNRMIRLHKSMGRKAATLLEYGRNITSLEQDHDESNVYTSVYPFARHTPEGSSESKIYTMGGKYYVDGKYIDMYNHRKVLLVDFSSEFEGEDIPTAERLKSLAEQYAKSNEVGAPHENLKVQYVDLSQTLDYEDYQIMEEVELNDNVPIVYKPFDIINRNAKVVSVTYYPTLERNKEIELGVVGQRLGQAINSETHQKIDQIERKQNEQVKYLINAQGNRIWYAVPDENMEHKIGDVWFEKNGMYTRLKVWNGSQWITEIDTEDVDKIAKEVEQAQQDIAEAKQTADDTAQQVNTAVANAGFLDLSGALTGIQQISQTAQSNAENALAHSLNAIGDASTALSNSTDALSQVANIDIRVNEAEGTLELKADKQEVDTLSGIVDTHTLDIQANAESLALKANQSTVDTLAGTVQSLGTEFGVVAGQVSSRVWNTDIEAAIDGLVYENRNLVLNSDERTTSGNYLIGTWLMSEEYIEGQEYTVTVWGEVNEGQSIELWFHGGSSNQAFLKEVEDGKWQATFTARSRGYTGRELEFRLYSYPPNTSSSAVIEKVKLEKGTKATPYSVAPEDMEAKISHIETEWTQTFDSFSQSVSSIDGRVTAQKQTIDSITSTVGNVEGDIATIELTINGLQNTVADKASQTQVTQLSNLLNSTVTTVDGHETQISQLHDNINLRVEKGELMSQINIEAGRTLIQSNRLYLDAQSVVFSGNAFIPSVAIKSLTADKITTGTLNAANLNVINLNTSDIVGLNSTFVTSRWNENGSDVRITGRGIVTTADDQSQTYIQNGIVGTRNPSGATIGQIGYVFAGGSPVYTIRTSLGSNFSIISTTRSGTKDMLRILPGSSEMYLDTDDTRVMGGLTVEGNTYMRNALYMGGSNVAQINQLQFNHGGSIVSQSSNSNMVIAPNHNLVLRSRGSTALLFDRTHGYMHRTLSMEGNSITNQSDLRLKHDIKDTELNSLETIKSWNFVNYYWNDPDKRGQQFGLIAQRTNEISLYDEERDLWSINSSKQIMMNSHAIQQLALMEDDTNLLASKNRTLIEKQQDKIEAFEQRIKELESVA